MAYIKIEKAIAEIDKGDLLVGNNAEWAKEILFRTPTADVVERSSFEQLGQKYLSFQQAHLSGELVEVKHAHIVRNERNIAKMKEFHEKGIGLGMSEKSVFWTCSECGSLVRPYDKYCSECGAKMDGGKAE